jgi:FMN reductase
MDHQPFHIVAIGGSHRDGSNTLRILNSLTAIAEDDGATTDLIDVHKVVLPVYEPEKPREQQPRALLDLLPVMQRADGFVLATPTYHGTLSGAVKNLLDALDHFIDDDRGTFAGRPVGVAAYGGTASMNAINALSHAARAFNGVVVPTILSVPFGDFDDTGLIASEAARTRARELVREVLQFATWQRMAEPEPAR